MNNPLNKLFKKKIDTISKNISYYVNKGESTITQQMKGEVKQEKIRFPGELGEEHPFNYKTTEGLYKFFGLVTGVVDKYVDFIVGPGFFVKTEDERVKTIIDDFLRDTNFDTLLRKWIKEALIKGTGFLELGGKKGEIVEGMKVLNSNFMFINRDSKGKILKYNQFRGDMQQFVKQKIIPFEPFQIAQISFNTVGDEVYGQGIVHPAEKFINTLIGLEANMNLLMDRKANAPIHAKLGSIEEPVAPSDITSFGKDLEWMTNKHEFATDHNVDMKVVDFGNFGDKFDKAIEHNLDMLFFTFQVPEVLMGRGSIPEGLAQVQMDAFQRRVQSFQAEIEKVIEQQIFTRVLEPQGFQDHVEFEWGRPSDTEKQNRIMRINELLKLMTLSPEMVKQLNLELARLLGFNEQIIEEAEEERREIEETEEEQPRVPGQNRRPVPADQSVNCGHDHDTSAESVDIPIKEWLLFDYTKYLEFILNVLEEDPFEQLAGVNRQDFKDGKLTKVQTSKLRKIMRSGFIEGQTLKTMSDRINEDVKLKDRLNEKGTVIVKAADRGIMIARSETTRLAAEGSLNFYKDEGVEEYQWVATFGQRTCPICENLNAQTFKIGKGPKPPAHAMCRCTTIPVVRG